MTCRLGFRPGESEGDVSFQPRPRLCLWKCVCGRCRWDTLYRVDSDTGAVTATGELDFGTGIVQGPIVDSTAGLVYVFASSDGTETCTQRQHELAPPSTNLPRISVPVTWDRKWQSGASTAPGKQRPRIRCTLAPSTCIQEFDKRHRKPLRLRQYRRRTHLVPGSDVAALFRGPEMVLLLLCFRLRHAPHMFSGDRYPQCKCHRRTHGKGLRERGNQWFAAGCASGGCVLNFVDTQWQPSTAYNIGPRGSGDQQQRRPP